MAINAQFSVKGDSIMPVDTGTGVVSTMVEAIGGGSYSDTGVQKV
jgi:hypothetical protein